MEEFEQIVATDGSFQQGALMFLHLIPTGKNSVPRHIAASLRDQPITTPGQLIQRKEEMDSAHPVLALGFKQWKVMSNSHQPWFQWRCKVPRGTNTATVVHLVCISDQTWQVKVTGVSRKVVTSLISRR